MGNPNHPPSQHTRKMFFSKKPMMSKLGSSESMLDQPPVVKTVTIIKKTDGLDVGLTVGNTEEGVGVLVVSVKQGLLAHRAGLRAGDVIVTINEHVVGTHSSAVTLIDRASNGIVNLGLGHSQCTVPLESRVVEDFQRPPLAAMAR